MTSTKASISNPNAPSDGRAAVMEMNSNAEHKQANDGKGSPVNREHLVIFSEFSAVDVYPDGDLEKAFWTGPKRIRFDESAFSRTKHPETETLVASRWTYQYLYLAFWCHYQSLNTYQDEDPGPERWQLWEKDVVEVFINPTPDRPSHYYEFEVAPNNQWLDLEIDFTQHPFNDLHWNSGFRHETRIDAARHVWTVEMRIPVASMTAAEADSGTEWRANFYRCDGVESEASRRMLSWGALPLNLPEHSFHQPASFGTIRFIRAGGAKKRY
ncbi:MAG: carbohydrate-binding family 9-like protein [Terracidiphilus sp.]